MQLFIPLLNSGEQAPSLPEDKEMKCENWGCLGKQLLEISLHLTVKNLHYAGMIRGRPSATVNKSSFARADNYPGCVSCIPKKVMG